MKKVILAVLVVSLFSLPWLSCVSKSRAEPKTQTVTVRRGDLATDITGVGNLALSYKVDLAFKMDGTVEEVLVEEGESVAEGQLLAKLDSSAWEDYIAGLEDKVTAAERTVTTKERAVSTAERQVVTRTLDPLQAQVNLQTAQDNLNKLDVVAQAKKAVDDAQFALAIAQAAGAQAELIAFAQKNLAEAQKELKEVLAGSSVKVTGDVATALAINRLQVEIARGRLDSSQAAVEDAKVAVEDARTAVGDARKALEGARKTLDEAKSTSPEVTASFGGFIIKVNVKGGDIVKKGAVAATLADPTRFEADVMVSEANIAKVKVGGTASVQVEAVPGVSLAANVTHIAPTATIQSGVVNYKVKVEIRPLPSVTTEQPPATGDVTSGKIPSEAPSPVSREPSVGGNLTGEQRDQMLRQRQRTADNVASGNTSSRSFRRPSGGDNLTQGPVGQNPISVQRQRATGNVTSGTSSAVGQARQAAITIPGDFQLKEGLTVTVSIIVQQKINVLLIPNTAITQQRGKSYVKVSHEGGIEEREITVGLSNWQYTEITDGLNEGEQVIISQPTSATPTTKQQPGIIPGMPRMLR